MKEELNPLNTLSDVSVPVNITKQNEQLKGAEHGIQVSDISLGQMTKILLEKTICVSGRETHPL
jgi:hypothetical protein